MKLPRCCECDYWTGKKKVDGGTGEGRCAELSWLVSSFDKVKGICFHNDNGVKVSVTTEEDFFCGKFVDKSKRKL